MNTEDKKKILITFVDQEECFDCGHYFLKKEMAQKTRYLCLTKPIKVYICKKCDEEEIKSMLIRMKYPEPLNRYYKQK